MEVDLVPISFRTTAVTKHRLIQEAKQRGVTLSEVVSDIVTYYNHNENLREAFKVNLLEFIDYISDGRDASKHKYLSKWSEIVELNARK
jgi:hypothetical protein